MNTKNRNKTMKLPSNDDFLNMFKRIADENEDIETVSQNIDDAAQPGWPENILNIDDTTSILNSAISKAEVFTAIKNLKNNKAYGFDLILKNDVPALETIIKECNACKMSESDISKLINLYLLLYADDTVVFSESPNDLQSRLH